MTEKPTYSLVPSSDPASETLKNLPAIPPDLRVEDEWFDPKRDLIVPRLSLLQAMSAECQTDGSTGEPMVPGARPGLYYNSMSRQVYKPPIAVVVVRTTKHAIFFGDEKQNLSPCQSHDLIRGTTYGECKACPYNWERWTDGMPPRCAETISFLVIPPESTGALLLSCMKTALKPARQFVNQRRSVLSTFLKNWWDRPSLLGVQSMKNDKGTFYVPTFNFDTKAVTDETTRRIAYEAYNWSEGKRLATEPEGNGGHNPPF